MKSPPTMNSKWEDTVLFPWQAVSSIIVSSHDQQEVCDTALCLCKAVLSMMSYFMTNSMWEWHCFNFLPGSSIMSHPMTNRVWVGALFLFQAVSSIINHPMTNRKWVWLLTSNFFAQQWHIPMANSLWVTLLHAFVGQSHQSWFIHTTESEWHWLISLLGSLIQSHPMTNSKWVILLFISLLGNLNHD